MKSIKEINLMMPHGKPEANFLLNKIKERKINITALYSSKISNISDEKNIIHLDVSKLYNNLTVKEALISPFVLKEDSGFDFTKMYECEHYFMSTMDRLSIKSQTLNKRKDLFREICILFSKLFSSNTVTHICYQSTPHFGWDIVSFFVAKYYNVETIILHKTDSSNIYFFRSDWRDEHNLTKKEKNINTPIYTEELFNQEESVHLKKIKELKSTILNSDSLISKNFKELNLILRYLHFFFFLIFTNKFDKWHDSSFYCNSNISRLEKVYFYILNYFKINKKIRICNKYSTYPKKNSKYIYFALHAQPERTSQPEGMQFADQILAIKKLSLVLPDDTKIYVKEHWAQFIKWPPENSLFMYNERPDNFYEEISKINKVELIDFKHDSRHLIENSICVTTITGSVGLEALKINKPVITFGYPWYSCCKSNFHFSNDTTQEDIQEFLQLKTKNVIATDVNDFLLLIQPYCFRSMPVQWDNFENVSDKDKLADNYINNLIEFIFSKTKP